MIGMNREGVCVAKVTGPDRDGLYRMEFTWPGGLRGTHTAASRDDLVAYAAAIYPGMAWKD